jgi:hypothetical protein
MKMGDGSLGNLSGAEWDVGHLTLLLLFRFCDGGAENLEPNEKDSETE